MKKYLFLAVAATALFASCSNDEVVEMNPQNAIGFSTFVDKSTRATDITSDNLKDFKVWGYQGESPILDGENVTGSGQDWSYANTQYWVAGQNYVFHAIAPATCENGDSYTYTGSNASYSIAFTNGAGQTDLIFDDDNSAQNVVPASQTEIPFTFNHLLSRVRFKFTEVFANEAVKVQVTDLKISGVASKGTYNGTWTITEGETADYSFTVGTGNAAFSTSAVSDHFYFIPNTQNLAISFKVQGFQSGVAIAEAVTKTITIENFTMEEGKSYEFNAEFDEDNIADNLYPIEFTVTEVTKWENYTEETVTVPAAN